ncbi:LytTR family DNA-binding domain-containing protein [Arcicella sp. LKC2W]|uniref:LytR/AlgR family response regulator transcription factor n=1 Tax=Arcicella sp. LKC2W TaxID=2984198 RepID=UPI002B20EA87|nr:LytTR family DNA-binding domain-containing protein [Arcicella sp. LKC2W]MEA5461207.1 LytTR family DNA-binding domain-containing protein [Arcicella sp. LKC2W]
MKTYKQKGNESLLILNQKTYSKVLINQIVLIRGDINYTVFHIKGGTEKTVAHTIKFFEPHLKTHGFLRVHRAFMINPNYVKEYDAEKEYLTMSDGQTAMISRRRKHTLKQLIR